MTSREFTLKGFKFSFYEYDTGGYNCGMKFLCSWNVRRDGLLRFSKEELYAVIDTPEFGKAVVAACVQTNPPAMFFLSAGLSYASDEVAEIGARTRDVMAGIARSKLGAWVTSPIFDNKGHKLADSLQMGMFWWPEPNVAHIVSSRPKWFIPKDKILVGMVQRWRWRHGKLSQPDSLWAAIKMVMKNFGFSGKPLVAKPKIKEKKIAGWPDIK